MKYSKKEIIMQKQLDNKPIRAIMREMKIGSTEVFPITKLSYIKFLVYSLSLEFKRNYSMRVDRENDVCRVTLLENQEN